MVTSSAVVGSSAMRQLGIAGERHRDHHALAHPTGKLMRILVDSLFGVGNAYHLEQFDRPGARLAFVHAHMQLQRFADLPVDSQDRIGDVIGS